MSNESNEILREVQASLKNEQIINFFKKNKKNISIFTSIFVVGALALGYYNLSQTKKNKKYSTHIQKAVSDQKVGKISESKADLEAVFYDENSPQKLQAIAGFRLAAIYLSEGEDKNIEKVLEIYETINNCQSCDLYSKDLAGMLFVKLHINNSADGDYEQIIKKIVKIENSSKIYRNEIAIDRGFYELQQGNIEKSKKIFEFIANSPDAKVEVKKLAQDGLKIIEAKANKS